MSEPSPTPRRVLLVQCCHPPQLIFAARKLARLHPDWRLEALARDQPEVRKALERAPEFRRIHWASESSVGETRFDAVVFPLLNRGYARIKRRAADLSERAWELDYEGSLRPLRKDRLWASILRSPHRATVEFAEFLKEFAPQRLGPRILFVHSGRAGQIDATRETWSGWLPEGAKITKVADEVGWREFRRLRRKEFDSAVVFFTGERGRLRLKLLPFLLGVAQILVVNEHAACFLARPVSLARFAWMRFRHGVDRPPQSTRILLLQSEAPPYVMQAVRKLKERKLYPGAEIVLLCREADQRRFDAMPEIDRIVCHRGGSWRAKLRLVRRLRDLRPDIVSAIFSGRGVFRPAKALFFLFADRPLLAFNAGLDCYWVTPRSLPRLFRRDTPLFPEEWDKTTGSRVTMVQTEGWRYTLEALRKLRRPSLYPGARVTLWCSERDRGRFEGEPGVERIETFEEAARRGWFRAWRESRRRRPELTVAVFTGRPVFRKQKLLFWLLSRRSRLVFNARLDAYWLGWKTLPRLFRREPLLFGEGLEARSEALLIQTESEPMTRSAIQRMLSDRVVPQREIAVFCREDLRSSFASLPGVSRVYTYRAGDWRGSLATLRRMVRVDRDVAAAILSGRGVFRLQKLLFFALPARNRLVFNENLDCFYLPRSRAARLLRLPSLSTRRRTGAIAPALRALAKAALFLPRYGYLLLWLTAVKLRRARRLG